MKQFALTLLIISTFFSAFAQNTRIKDENEIGWYAFNATVKLDPRWSIAGEFQWRRDNLISDPQQNVYKLAVVRTIAPGVSARAGVALAETFNYGDVPLNNLGKQFTEHRIYEVVSLNNKFGRVESNHRFMLEQRWVGRYSDASLTKEDDYVYTNRFRYMYRMQLPLKGKEIKSKTPYVALYDEIFIGFGKNVNENVFDQNRIGALVGYQFSGKLRVEGGYLNQIAQLGREIGGRNLFQYNSGFIITTNINL